MAQDHRIQLQRFELKYHIKAEQALMVRNFAQSYLECDEYGANKPQLSYFIHSLYLDSDALTLYWHTVNGNKNRFKLRVRFYNDDPKAPVFFEIKRRMNDAILKQRAGVRREAVEPLLAGRLPAPNHLFKPDNNSMKCLQEFCLLMAQYQCKPKARVTYLREAWVSHEGNSVRVTMDRDVRTWPEENPVLSTKIPPVERVFGKTVIAELKFTARFPDWFGHMVRQYGMVQGCASKFADGINLIGPGEFSQHVCVQPMNQRRVPARKLTKA